MTDDETLRFYAKHAKVYASRPRGPAAQLHIFLQGVRAGRRILELGTGGGQDAAAMLALGFDVIPSDASPELAAQAELLVGRRVKLMRFDQLDDIGAYDGVWASAALLHAPKAELTDDLRRIHDALKAGGLFVASFKAGDGEGRDSLGRYYNYPGPEQLLQHYRDAANWQSIGLEEVMGSGYDNQPTRWLWVTARR